MYCDKPAIPWSNDILPPLVPSLDLTIDKASANSLAAIFFAASAFLYLVVLAFLSLVLSTRALALVNIW